MTNPASENSEKKSPIDYSFVRHRAIQGVGKASDASYAANMVATDLSGNNYQFQGVISMQPNLYLGLQLGNDYIGALYSGITAYLLLTDEGNYRRAQNKVKAVLNIVSSIQTFGLTYNPVLASAVHLASSATLATPAFAMSALADIISTTIDYCNAYKESTPEGWLEERIKEMAYLGTLEKKYLTRRDKINKIMEDCHDKLEACKKIHDNSGITFYQKKIAQAEKLVDKCKTKLAIYTDRKEKTNTAVQIRQRVKDGNSIPGDVVEDSDIQREMTRRYKKARKTLMIKSFSFIGMTCLAVTPFVLFCPPVAMVLAIVGMAFTSIVTAYFINKNAPRLAGHIYGLFHRKKEQSSLATAERKPSHVKLD